MLQSDCTLIIAPHYVHPSFCSEGIPGETDARVLPKNLIKKNEHCASGSRLVLITAHECRVRKLAGHALISECSLVYAVNIVIGGWQGQRSKVGTLHNPFFIQVPFFQRYVAAATSSCCSKGRLAMMTNRDSCQGDSVCCCVLAAESDEDVI